MRCLLLIAAAAAGLALLAGCGTGDAATGSVYADRVVDFAPVISQGSTEDDWPYFFQPEAALGEPGSLTDVVSLGYDPAATDATGGAITLGFGRGEGAAACIADGEGDDLAVYENPFFTTDPDSGGQATNNEVATVEVSADGSTWYPFPPGVDDAKTYADPTRYTNLAGVTPTAEGGDRFDLAGLAGLPDGFQACFVRLTDGGTLYPDFGNTQTDLHASGADIDAVEALHPVDPAAM